MRSRCAWLGASARHFVVWMVGHPYGREVSFCFHLGRQQQSQANKFATRNLAQIGEGENDCNLEMG